jgi:Tol biopolymer transport system component
LTQDAGTGEGAFAAAFAPEGRRIAFTADFDGDSDIYVVRINGTGLRKVTSTSVDDSSPSWSPDGRRIVFDRTEGNSTAIVVLDLATGLETEIAGAGLDGGDLVFAPAWQPAAHS